MPSRVDAKRKAAGLHVLRPLLALQGHYVEADSDCVYFPLTMPRVARTPNRTKEHSLLGENNGRNGSFKNRS